MSYTLQAIIAHEQYLNCAPIAGTCVVRLNEGLAMIPLTNEVQESLRIPMLPLTDEGRRTLDSSTKELCRQLSLEGRVAYIEAEIFGGTGIQACVLFEGGIVQEAPLISEAAVNHALRFLGICAMEGKDEFDVVGLNRERDTDSWVREPAV